MEKFNQIKYIQEYKKENYKRIALEVKPELKEQFQKAVSENGETMNNVLTKFIENYIERGNKMKKLTIQDLKNLEEKAVSYNRYKNGLEIDGSEDKIQESKYEDSIDYENDGYEITIKFYNEEGPNGRINDSRYYSIEYTKDLPNGQDYGYFIVYQNDYE